MKKQLTAHDIRRAKETHLYESDTLYVVMGPDEVYGFTEGGRTWFEKENFWDYFESEAMMTRFTSVTKEEAVRIFEGWTYKKDSDKRRLDDAIAFAVKKHSRQFRKGTAKPYIFHPLEAMQILMQMNADTDLQIAGVLHDTIEDTGATREEIADRFGEEVAGLVASHSEDKSRSWQERKNTAIAELAVGEPRFQMLVMSDKLSNLRSIAADYAQIGDALWNRFNAGYERQAWYYTSIAEALAPMEKLPAAAPFYRELKQLCRQVFRRQ